ncbi:serine hydrolase domain-containing protein [Nonomuraea recticatena]|uniref:serine hydrolase domain-containing protein n=1 Tax=Nonomuraea recticatena TaxID=46178 RepID=UPI0031F807FA
MSKASRRAVLGMLAAAPLSASGLAAASDSAHAQPRRSPSEPLRRYREYVSELAKKDQFSGVIMVAHRGRPVIAEAYGMADKKLGVRNRVDTRFNLGSASKPFSTLAIVQLAEQGKIEFYDKLGTYLQGFRPEVAEKVTVHQMLTHTSGMTMAWDPSRITYSREELWEIVRKALREGELQFTPGTQHAYGGACLDALGEIVTKITGMSYWDYVHEHIFGAAGMTGSRYYTRTEWLADPAIAHPYMLQADGSRVDALRDLKASAVIGGPGTSPARPFVGLPSVGAFSSAPDLVRLAQALQNHKLLTRPYTDLYVGPKFPAAPPPGAPSPGPTRREAFQAYGLNSTILGDFRVIGHGGGVGGGNANWNVYLGHDWAGVVLSNYDLDSKLFMDILGKEREAITSAAG